MISGTFYTGAAYTLILETNILLADADPVSIMVKMPDGTTILELSGVVVDLTSISATLTEEQNTQAGPLLLQAKATFDNGDKFGATETLYVLIPFAEAAP